jgi:iron(III) transport system substrate-binding protein
MGALVLAALFGGVIQMAGAAEINVYTGRHYDGDQLLYDGFTKATGIAVNIIQGKGDELLARLEAEAEASPADVFLTADAGNLWRAESAGVLQPVDSAALSALVPAQYRDPGNQWFGFSRRARVIYAAKDANLPFTIANYEDLARPELKGRLCMRSGSAIYNLSLLGSLIERWGADSAEAWAKGVAGNLAKAPQGGDTDQLKSVAAGECAATLANTYYFVRLLRSEKQDDRDIAAKLTVVFPDQTGTGTHVNISGAGVAKYAPNRDGAVKFLEYLAGAEAQAYFGRGNNEYPVKDGPSGNAELDGLGAFKADPVNVSVYGKNQKAAQEIMDRAGWK